MRRAPRLAFAAAAVAAGVLLAAGPTRPLAADEEKEKERENDPAAKARERVRRIAEELRVLGFAIELDRLSVEVKPAEACLADIDRQQDALFASSYYEAMHYFLRHAFSIPTGKDGAELRREAVRSTLPAYLAYYQPDRKALVFLDAGGGPGLLGAGGAGSLDYLVAHELAHAWRDQREGGIGALLREAERRLERSRLVQCLVEGEAEAMAIAVMLARDGKGLRDLEVDRLDGAIDRLLAGEHLAVPYVAGRTFAIRRFQEAGWAAVSRLFEEPPASTEQLLHPEKLGRDRPTKVDLPPWPEAAGASVLIHEDELGEMGIYTFLLSSGATRDEAFLAAAGWDGDRLRVYELAGGGRAALWRVVLDREEDARQLEAALRARASGISRVERRGPAVDWVAASAPEAARRLASALAEKPAAGDADWADAETTAKVEAAWAAAQARGPAVVGEVWAVPEHGLALPVPAGWREREVRGTKVLIGPVGGGFADNINVIRIPVREGATVDDLLAENRAQLAAVPSLALDRAEKARLAGRDAVLLEYHGRLPGPGAPAAALHFVAIIYLRGRDQVVVTATILEERWPAQGKAAEKALLGAEIDGD